MIADARQMPFADGAFDVVFANSIIEHVGDQASRQTFAAEVRRVGKRYYVQTPNQWFPVEPHLWTPFIHYLPAPLQKRLLRNFTVWGWLVRPTQQGCEEFVDQVRLLTVRELKALFPDGGNLEGARAGLDEVPHRRFRFRPILDNTERNHRIRDLDEPPDIGSLDIVDIFALPAMPHASQVDTLHHFLQFPFHLGAGPGQELRVLRALKPRDSDAAGVGCLAGSEKHIRLLKNLHAGRGRGHIGAFNNRKDTVFRELGGSLFGLISFCVAQGIAISALTPQGFFPA